MPIDFDSHRVQKQSVQEQLLQSMWRHSNKRTNEDKFYNTMPLPVSSSNDNYNNGNNDDTKILRIIIVRIMTILDY